MEKSKRNSQYSESVSTSEALTEIYGKAEINAIFLYVNVASSCFHSIKFITDKEIPDARRVKSAVKLKGPAFALSQSNKRNLY
jgi:hypothetical protein